MNPRHVRSATIGITAILLSATAAFGWLARSTMPPPAAPLTPPAGAAQFEQYCGGCHSAEALAGRIRQAADRDALLREFERFLASHGDAPPDADRTIVEYLRSLGR